MRKLLAKLFGRSERSDTRRAFELIQEGYVLAKTGRLTPALAKYDEACRAAPDAPLAFLNRALCRQDLYNLKARTWSSSQVTEALVAIADDLERTVELDPSSLPALRCLGHVSRRLCRYARAEAAFTALLERAPDDYPHRAEAVREQGLVKGRAGKERAIDAVMALLEEKDADPAVVGAALAALAPFLDETKAAQSEAPPAPAEPASAPSTPADGAPLVDVDERVLPVDVVFAAGALARRTGDVVRAAECQAMVLALDREHPGAHRELSTLAAQAGNADAALRHALLAYQGDPSNPALVCNVGVAYLSCGRLDEAAEYLGIAKDLAPRDPIVERALSALDGARRAPA